MAQLATAPIRRAPVRMSYEAFLRTYMNGERLEWVNGEVVPMPPIGAGHTESLHLLISVFKAYVEHHDLGKLRSDPFQMKTGPNLPGRQPDLLFVAKRNLGRLHPLYLDGPADLVIEIASPKTRTVDRVVKFKEYEAGGVREYWIVDPIRQTAEFYRLGRDGKFHLVEPKDGVFRSRVVKGFWFRVDWLWAQPSLMTIFGELGLT